MKKPAPLKTLGLPEVSLAFATTAQHRKLLYNHLFAVTDMLVLSLYFLIFFCPWNYLVFVLCLSIFLKLNSFCAQTASKLLAPSFVSLFSPGRTSNICFVATHGFHSLLFFF